MIQLASHPFLSFIAGIFYCFVFNSLTKAYCVMKLLLSRSLLLRVTHHTPKALLDIFQGYVAQYTISTSSVASGGGGGGYSPLHWPADQNAE